MKTKDKLKIYFGDEKLKNFDNNDTYKCFDDNSYGAVSVKYLAKYLFKNRISHKFISKKLFELMQEGLILPIPCNFANDLVFTTTKYADGKFFSKFSFTDNGVEMPNYYANNQTWVDRVNLFNSYL